VVETALIIGGSNARDLAYATSSLSVETYKLATGGWNLSRENVDKLIPDLKELLSGLPSKTPVIFFWLDNSSFQVASEEGGLIPISKCVPEEDGYHVAGALVMSPEGAMQYAIAQLRRAIAECGYFPVFVVTPWSRYVSQPCCTDAGHVTNFQDPDFLADILRDLNKQKFQLSKSLAPAIVLDGVQLVCGENSTMERKEQTMRAGWASDPVHPDGHIYAKMALNLIEKIAPVTDVPGASISGNRKKHGAQATERRARAAAADSGSRTAEAVMEVRVALAAAAEAAAVGSGNTTAGAAATVVMADPDPDPAEFRIEAQPGRQVERAAPTCLLANEAEGAAAVLPDEAAVHGGFGVYAGRGGYRYN
jgi:hypothetical protein